MRRVLVTGATGVIGRHALPALREAGHEVHAVARTPGVLEEGVTWHEGDLLASADVVREVRPDALLHFAWYAEHGKYWTSPENVRWVEASLALLRAFAESGGRRAVLTGSCAEYDWFTGAELLAEDAPLRPASIYGSCKHALHVAAAAYAEQVGFSLAWGRPFFLFGPGENPGRLVQAVMAPLVRGEEAPLSKGDQVRDFLDAPQVAQGFCALLDSEVTGAVNVASGRGVSVRELATIIAEQVGRPDLLRFGAIEDRPGQPPVLIADTTRLNEEVGWRPAVSLEDAIGALVRRQSSTGAAS